MPGEPDECDILTAYIVTVIVSSYVPASATTFSTVTSFQSEITMGCDVQDSTTTTTQEASATYEWVEFTVEPYYDTPDDYDADALASSEILADLLSWGPTFSSSTTTSVQTTVDPRPTINNGYPIGEVTCYSSTNRLTTSQMTSGYGVICGKIGGKSTTAQSDTETYGSISALFTFQKEPECSGNSVTYSEDDCNLIFSEITGACTSNGVGGGYAYADTCYEFGVQLLGS